MKEESLRIDKWLWHARFAKSRSLAARLCTSGGMRVSGTPVRKAHHALKAGDVLTFPLGPHIRVIKVLALGQRRGPASEARTLYEDLSPPPGRGAMVVWSVGHSMPSPRYRVS
ncbi:MAG: RNA-binding S4 domain-containing protein [Proteobacteria bacterium]|nr:RNA-binding S4 domain-containing protein [Pseudomonadota bacterium]